VFGHARPPHRVGLAQAATSPSSRSPSRSGPVAGRAPSHARPWWVASTGAARPCEISFQGCTSAPDQSRLRVARRLRIGLRMARAPLTPPARL